MTYFKIFAISVCSSLLFLSIFVMVAFDSENTLSKAYEHFAEKQYYEARQLLMHEDNAIPLADYYMYEAYLAREELGIKKSQGYLLQALQEHKTRKSSSALEIALNLCMDAYLQKNGEDLKIAIEETRHHTTSDQPWIYFFEGCLSYLNRDYKHALIGWEMSTARFWLSNWMKTSFENHLSHQQIELARLHSEIEIDQFWMARQILQEYRVTFPECFHNDIDFLLAASYMKECEKMPFEKRSLILQKVLELFNQVPSNNLFLMREKNRIFNPIKEQILQDITHHRFGAIPLYISSLEKYQSHEDLESVANNLVQIFNEKLTAKKTDELDKLTNGFCEFIPSGKFKNILELKLVNSIAHAVDQENLSYLEVVSAYSEKLLTFQQSQLVAVLESKILELVEREKADLKKTKFFVHFLTSIDKNPSHRLFFAQHLIQKAQQLWVTKKDDRKALTLMKISETLPCTSERSLIYADIQKAIAKTYQQAVLQDDVSQFFSILAATKEFHVCTDIFDAREAVSQLADAEYLFNAGRWADASIKAKWVLQLDSNNSTAKKILALIAYEEGQYQEVVDRALNLPFKDEHLLKTLSIAKILTGDPFEVQFYLETLAMQPLSNDTILRLGFGYLMQSQPDQGLIWLNKIQPMNPEILIGFCIAAFQKQEWNKVVSLYKQLGKPYSDISAIQGIVIQALVAQNLAEEAHTIFSEFLVSSSTHSMPGQGSKAFILLQKQLSAFDKRDFATRYLLYVKKEPHLAKAYSRNP